MALMAATIGVIGLGKLGLPVAVTLAMRGHKVLGYDRNPDRMSLTALSPYELDIDRAAPLSDVIEPSLPLRFTSLEEMLVEVSCVFVLVDTPHRPAYDGTTPLPESRADFGYDALTDALADIARLASRPVEIGVMSTVLPGTTRSKVLPLTEGHQLVYCPQFVGMGTVAADLCAPEFVLMGCDGPPPPTIEAVLTGFAPEVPVFVMDVESAELAKVVYNTFISAKVTVANVVQRMAHEVGADAGAVYDVINAADRRILSPAYIGPGMGDGGPCHPRDNIALSWLARTVGDSADLFTAVMRSRQAYVEWLGDLFVELAGDLPMVLLGTAFKPGTDLEAGSSAVLMANLLRLAGVELTVVPGPADLARLARSDRAAAFFLGNPCPEFVEYPFPPGSVVVDPWHRVRHRDDLTLHRVGARPRLVAP